MHYLSPEFALAFLAFLWIYWTLAAKFGTKAQNILLLLASYGFYACFDWRFCMLLISFSVCILALAQIAEKKHALKQRWPVVLGVLLALGNLGVFKYYNFFREEANAWLAPIFHSNSLPILDLLMPVGISFYTFQGIAYLVTIGRGERTSASWLNGLLHLAFFPTLLAGPICRPSELLTQIESKTARTIHRPELALLLIISALVKKIWLAAWLANTWVNPVFANPDGFHPVELVGALFAYGWQLFFDFSGYTDVVTALALLLGFSLPENFRQPYLATNLSDFWRRWHITLSRWIRDFIYIPLGGNRSGWWRAQLNLLIAMVLSGFWHGASFTFIAWGLWHGLGLVLQNTWQKLFNASMPNFFALPITFLFVSCGWLLFRADDYESLMIYLNAFTQWDNLPSLNWLGLSLILVIFFAGAHNAQQLMAYSEIHLRRMQWWLQALVFSLVALAIMSLAPAGMPGFIYFGF